MFPAFSATGQDVFSAEFDYDRPGIVISAVGARCGKCFLATGKWSAIANTHVLLPHESVDARYLWYVVNDEDFWIKGGTAQPFVKVRDSLQIMIPLPPMEDQRRIAGLLDSVGDLRVRRTKVSELTRTIAPASFVERFGRPGTNPNGWPLVNLMSLSTPRQWPTIAKADFVETGYPVFGANGRIGHYDSYNHEEPTVLISCRGTCGIVNVSPAKAYVTGNAMALDDRDDSIVHLRYLEWVLRLRGLQDTVTGSSQPQITQESLRRVFLPIPPLDRQAPFVAEVEQLDRIIERQQAVESGLAELFESVRAAALDGTT